MLTHKQSELLSFIDTRMKESGVPPSFDEMRRVLELKSKSGIHRMIIALEERGFIRRLPHRARAIEVLKMPELQKRGTRPHLLKGGAVENSAADIVSVPVMGRIAAGTPIEALQSPTHSIGVPPDMLGAGEHYALEVRGDSMIDAGILDGDLALIQHRQTADTGDIVVAVIDDSEATLKRLRHRGAAIALEPANPAYEVRILPPHRVSIQGKLVGIYRKY